MAKGRVNISMKLIKFVRKTSVLLAVVTIQVHSSQSQWIRIPSPQASATVSAMASSGQNMYIGTKRGMVVSSDNGISWQKCNVSLTDTVIESIVTAGEAVFAGIQSKGLFISNDKGGHWKPVDSVLQGKHIERVNTGGGVVIARDDDGSTYISFDNGVTWREDELGKKINAIATFGSLIVAATNSHGIYRTSDSGKTWIKVNDSYNFIGLAVRGQLLFGSSGPGVFRSSDSGKTWVNVKSVEVTQIVAVDSIVVAAMLSENSVLRSSDNGVTWEQVKIDVNQDPNQSYSSGQLAVHNSKLYISARQGLFQSINKGTTWSPVATGLLEDVSIGSLTGQGDTLFAGTGYHGVFRSNDGGQSWVAINNGLTILNTSKVAISGSALFAATFGGVFCSLDNGTTWVSKNSGMTSLNVTSIASSGARLYAGTSDSGLFISTDKGDIWVPVIPQLSSKKIESISTCDNTVIVKTLDSGLYISTNNGSSWTRLQSPSLREAFATDGRMIVAATNVDIVFSADSGKTWSISDLMVASSYYSSFVIRDGSTFVGSTGGVHLSNDWGKNWTPVLDGFPSNYTFISYIEAIGSKLYACGGGLWVRPIAQMTHVNKQPQITKGSQSITFNVNLPRSSWSEAFVEFKLPSAQNVKLTICSSTGRLIKTLVNKHLEAGSYSYRLDMRILGAGCYLANMKTDAGIQTKKFMK